MKEDFKMLSDIDVARYFIGKDCDGTLFNTNLVTYNGRTFYEGNARLNKFLQLAQNIYIAKTGSPLMDTTFYAYDNGAVVPKIQENYKALLKQGNCEYCFDDNIREFLDRFYAAFKSADITDLIVLSHEDEAWIEKHKGYRKEEQQMETSDYRELYARQYCDIIRVMDRMTL